MNKKLGRITTALIVVLLLAAISLLIQWQRGIRTESQIELLAQAPCIENVCPGLVQDRSDVLEELDHSKVMKARLTGPDDITLLFDQSISRHGSGDISFQSSENGESRVSEIGLGIEGLRLDTVLRSIGDPDDFLYISGCGMGSRVFLELYYWDKGIVVNAEFQADDSMTHGLSADTPVSVIYYLHPDKVKETIEETAELLTSGVLFFNAKDSRKEDIIGQIQPWQGLETKPTPTADFCPK